MKDSDILFEKVSIDQFLKDIGEKLQYNTDDQIIRSQMIMAHDMFVTKPKRATKGSCGYDFVSPVAFSLGPKKKVIIPTGIRVKMPSWAFLMIAPRSSLGIKYQLGLANTVGIIDSDYYYAKNEGHIMIALENRGEDEVFIEAGDRFAQGIFLTRILTTDDDTTRIREGGMGSTGR